MSCLVSSSFSPQVVHSCMILSLSTEERSAQIVGDTYLFITDNSILFINTLLGYQIIIPSGILITELEGRVIRNYWEGMEKQGVVVIDNGTETMKCQMSYREEPERVPSVVGYPVYDYIMDGMNRKEVYVGEDAVRRKSLIRIRCPFQDGIITSYDDAMKLWHHCVYSEIKEDPMEFPFLLTQNPLNPKSQREKTAEIMFQTFQVPQFYLAPAPALSLFASGKTTGVVLSAGEGNSYAVPVFEGSVMTHAVQRNTVSGRSLTAYMEKIIAQSNELSAQFKTEDLFVKLKEVCSVSLAPEKEFQKRKHSDKGEMNVLLPDGKIVSLSSETNLWTCPEELFRLTKMTPSLHRILVNSIQSCDIDLRRTFFSQIVLAGGTTLFQNFQQRLRMEIRKEMQERGVPEVMKESIFAPEDRIISAWRGGSLLCSLSSLKTKWIAKQEYEEWGPEIVNRKCV